MSLELSYERKLVSSPAGGVVLATGGTVVAPTGRTLVLVKALARNATLLQQDRYWMFFDAAAMPADGVNSLTVPIRIAPNAHASLDFLHGLRFTAGINWCSSTTDLTKTITLVADMFCTFYYYTG